MHRQNSIALPIKAANIALPPLALQHSAFVHILKADVYTKENLKAIDGISSRNTTIPFVGFQDPFTSYVYQRGRLLKTRLHDWPHEHLVLTWRLHNHVKAGSNQWLACLGRHFHRVDNWMLVKWVVNTVALPHFCP